MHNSESFLQRYKQNNKLSIRLISPTFGNLPIETLKSFGLTQRKPYYFLLFMVKGKTQHRVDLQQFDLTDNELLFILPHQIHQLPEKKPGTQHFKLGFDDNCLSLLPKQYPFLINPLNNLKIKFTPSASTRIKGVFETLQQLLSKMDTDHELILAHLNSLLTEINAAYFQADKKPVDDRLAHYIDFKLFIENNLTALPAVKIIAQKLGLNTNSMYSLVKHYSGYSPKEYITNRLMLEAKRRLCYAESSSIKELAYALGFNDPEYFSRQFKKVTGVTVGAFAQDLSGK